MGLYQTKKLLHTKEAVTRLKRLPTEWEKIFVSYSSTKGLIFRIYREPQKINISVKKWAHELNKEFSKEEA
jgi:hypothetical protein